ncbi:hypothetical protein CFP56_001868 [Quercus suber]|uniref:Uncharacterized protein n=1 Tax=Quercus suber TaxID=58331 RepID=A0AAW0ILH9_QUESU
MLPPNSFSPISMVTISLQFFKEDGNFPENLLSYRCKYIRSIKDPMDAGILPRFPNDLGIFPPSSLNGMRMHMADVRFPMELEIVPCKLVESRFKNSRRLKLYNQLGIEELKLFKDRSRRTREVMFWRPTGIGP